MNALLESAIDRGEHDTDSFLRSFVVVATFLHHFFLVKHFSNTKCPTLANTWAKSKSAIWQQPDSLIAKEWLNAIPKKYVECVVLFVNAVATILSLKEIIFYDYESSKAFLN